MRDADEKTVWGQVEKIGKGTKANYDANNKTLTFCFNRNPNTTSDQLKKLRESLIKELLELGYVSRMKYNGEVIADKIEQENVVIERKNHKLIIHLNKKPTEDKEKGVSETLT